jgi:hypothetical protein
VPYASFGDPQSLNLYAYVENAPLNRVEADGHYANSPTPSSTIVYGDSPQCNAQIDGICSFKQVEDFGLGAAYSGSIETDADAQNKQSAQ